MSSEILLVGRRVGKTWKNEEMVEQSQLPQGVQLQGERYSKKTFLETSVECNCRIQLPMKKIHYNNNNNNNKQTNKTPKYL